MSLRSARAAQRAERGRRLRRRRRARRRPGRAAAALAGFTGARRRMEPKGEAGGVRVSTTTRTTRPRWPPTCAPRARSPADGRGWSSCSSRTCSAGPDLRAPSSARRSALADEVVVLDVYAAREDPEPGVTGRSSLRRCRRRRGAFVPVAGRRAARSSRHRRAGRPGADHGGRATSPCSARWCSASWRRPEARVSDAAGGMGTPRGPRARRLRGAPGDGRPPAPRTAHAGRRGARLLRAAAGFGVVGAGWPGRCSGRGCSSSRSVDGVRARTSSRPRRCSPRRTSRPARR